MNWRIERNKRAKRLRELEPWDDRLVHRYSLFHPERLKRWERIYKQRLGGATHAKIALAENCSDHVIKTTIRTVNSFLKAIRTTNDFASIENSLSVLR